MEATIRAGASRHVAAAVGASLFRCTTSRTECADIGDEFLSERISAVSQSLRAHREDCLKLGKNIHNAITAAALAGGNVKENMIIHKRANVAKHEGLHVDQPLRQVRQRRGGKQDAGVHSPSPASAKATPIHSTPELSRSCFHAGVQCDVPTHVESECQTMVHPSPSKADVSCHADGNMIRSEVERNRPEAELMEAFQAKVDAHKAKFPGGKLPSELRDFHSYLAYQAKFMQPPEIDKFMCLLCGKYPRQ
eukprot:TRINITY_DN50702_c0_g1_i1.p1 TRINITY_DN50702_c0_g1~~TRINITY_DN50702_c0_g1_i1.p1  ORF type:complete len:273 (-),score=29.80 TRINITY_DN50702_c0_g1_i1:307-1056(-)